MDDHTTIRMAPHLVGAEVDGEFVLLDPASGNYYGLNAVASTAWHLLRQQPRTLAELVTAVCADFEVAPERCRADLMAWVGEVATRGLVTLSHASSDASAPDQA